MKEPKDNAGQADRAAEQENAERKQEYLIKFIPPKGDEIRSIRLSARALKWGAVSLAAGAMLFVGAFSYSVYSTFAARSSADEVRNLREVNNIQQEQLLQLSKKANALQDQLDQLKSSRMICAVFPARLRRRIRPRGSSRRRMPAVRAGMTDRAAR